MLVNFLGVKTIAYGIFMVCVISPKGGKKGAAEWLLKSLTFVFWWVFPLHWDLL